jgi:hypothetical protein
VPGGQRGRDCGPTCRSPLAGVHGPRDPVGGLRPRRGEGGRRAPPCAARFLGHAQRRRGTACGRPWPGLAGALGPVGRRRRAAGPAAGQRQWLWSAALASDPSGRGPASGHGVSILAFFRPRGLVGVERGMKMAASEVTLEPRELVAERESDSGLQAAAHPGERSVFVAKDGRRARALRGVARVAAGLMLLWIVALVAGAVGAGRLPVAPFPAVGSAADSAREGGQRPGVADQRAGGAVRRPSPAPTPAPVAPGQLTVGRASGISHGERRRPSAPVTTRSATRQASRDTRREDEVRGTRAGGAPEPGGAGGGPEPGGSGGAPEQPTPGSRSPAGATGPAEIGPPAGTTPAETGPPSSQSAPGNSGSAPGSPFGQPPAAERPGPPATSTSDKPSPAGPPGGS